MSIPGGWRSVNELEFLGVLYECFELLWCINHFKGNGKYMRHALRRLKAARAVCSARTLACFFYDFDGQLLALTLDAVCLLWGTNFFLVVI